jgi:ABC-2 type transport system permease protein
MAATDPFVGDMCALVVFERHGPSALVMLVRVLTEIAFHELRIAWRSRVVVALAVALTLLAAVAGIAGAARHRAESEQRNRYQDMVGRQFREQPDRHPHRVSHYGYLVFRPRAPLGFFDAGVEHFAGTSIFLEAHRQNTANFSAAAQGNDGGRLGDLTLAAVLQFFVPLFVFAVAGVAVTREREAGTLPMLLCQGLPWSRLLWGKAAGALLLVLAVLGPALGVCFLALAVQGAVRWDADALVRATGLLALHAVFLLACAALAVTISAWQRTSRGALVWLIGLWLVGWILVPRALPMLASAIYPLPARAAFDAEVEARVMELGDSHNPDDPVFNRLREETLRRYGVSRVEDLPFNYNGLLMTKSEEATAAAFREHMGGLATAYQRQGRLLAIGGLVSPYMAVRLGSMALAGSDLAHHLEFERQAEAYRYRLVQALNALHANEVRQADDRYGQVSGGAPTRKRIDAAFFDALPVFEFEAPGAMWALGQQAIGLLALAAAAAAAVGGLAWTARQGVPVS